MGPEYVAWGLLNPTQQRAVVWWFQTAGIDPGDVPIDPTIELDAERNRYVVHTIVKRGRGVEAGRSFVRRSHGPVPWPVVRSDTP